MDLRGHFEAGKQGERKEESGRGKDGKRQKGLETHTPGNKFAVTVMHKAHWLLSPHQCVTEEVLGSSDLCPPYYSSVPHV